MPTMCIVWETQVSTKKWSLQVNFKFSNSRKTFFKPVPTRYLLITTTKQISKPFVRREAHFAGSIELLWLKGQGIITLAYLEGTWLHNFCNKKNVNFYSVSCFHLPFLFLCHCDWRQKRKGMWVYQEQFWVASIKKLQDFEYTCKLVRPLFNIFECLLKAIFNYS